jgi:hypothetical protein
MRKVLILLVAFAVMGTAAFADGKFTAWNEGIAFLYAQVGNSTSQVGWGPNWDKPSGAGADNEWTFGYDGKGYGFSGSFEFGFSNAAGGGPGLTLGNSSWQWFGAYFKPFGDAVKITLGAPRIDYVQWTYIEGYGAYSRFVSNDLAVAAEIKPMGGLTIGLADFLPANIVPGSLTLGNLGSGTNFDILSNFGVLLSYSMDNLGTLTAQYKVQNATGNPNTTRDSSNVGVGLNISAIQNIGINAGFNYDFVNSLMKVSASAKASLAPILIEADVAFAQSNVETADALKTVVPAFGSFGAEALVEYDMGTMGIGAQIGYDDGQGVGLLGESASAAWNGFEVYPYAVANFDNGSSIKIGFVYASGVAATANAAAGQSLIAIPITYVWAF